MPDLDSKMLPSLTALRAFDQTARHGSFANAARALNVTQAAVAQQVRSLEADLGVALARRAGRRVELTEPGRHFASALAEGFDSLARAVAQMRAAQDAAPVRLGTTIYISQTVILPRLHDFWRRYPGVGVSVQPSLDAKAMQGLQLDLAICAGRIAPDWPAHEMEVLLESPILPVAAPRILDGGAAARDLPWIWTAGDPGEERMLRELGLEPAKLRNVDLGSPFLQLSAVQQGLGAALVPEIIIGSELSDGRLVALPAPQEADAWVARYYLAIPTGPMRSGVRQFVAWLREMLRSAR